ncbi:hypothetical protein BLNAU_24935 [Blattamonas nauphoetae]|uniref:Uncharacterized protein n=1 Tax=Blattamonas nauphoetae TaxID=2049346 RepID=A0ABQ9WL16_9EUKA|nr:hypothetical protein BLNAU_24935 [Blattamonas nauphoetae]
MLLQTNPNEFPLTWEQSASLTKIGLWKIFNHQPIFSKEMRMYRAIEYYRHNQFSEAIALFDPSEELTKLSKEDKDMLARCHFRLGHFKQAETLCHLQLQYKKHDFNTLLLLADCYSSQQQLKPSFFVSSTPLSFTEATHPLGFALLSVDVDERISARAQLSALSLRLFETLRDHAEPANAERTERKRKAEDPASSLQSALFDPAISVPTPSDPDSSPSQPQPAPTPISSVPLDSFDLCPDETKLDKFILPHIDAEMEAEYANGKEDDDDDSVLAVNDNIGNYADFAGIPLLR